MRGTLRTFDSKVRARLKDAIARMAESTCAGMKARAEVEIIEGMPPLVHDPAIVDLIAEAARKTIGAENIVSLPFPSTGSDDFSVYLDYCPGVRFRIGTADCGRPETMLGNHNPRTVFDERAILAGTAVCCQFVMDFLAPPL
jgi:hippurate hydrolase